MTIRVQRRIITPSPAEAIRFWLEYDAETGHVALAPERVCQEVSPMMHEIVAAMLDAAAEPLARDDLSLRHHLEDKISGIRERFGDA